MKTRLLALAFGIAASFGASAAPTLNFSNTPPGWDGSFKIKLTGFESFTAGLTVGSENYGVLRVTSIEAIDGLATYWNSGDDGLELTGVFSGIKLANVSVSGVNVGLQATGGIGSFYLNPQNSLALAGGFAQGSSGYSDLMCSVNTNCYDGVTNVAAGVKLFDANWVAGVLDILGQPMFGGDLVTATSITVDGTLSLATGRGSAGGYLSVVPGSGSSSADFDTNGQLFAFNSPADMFANNTFCDVTNTNCAAQFGGVTAFGDWAFGIEDPISGRRVIPEPGSLALVGLGILGLSFVRRQRRK